MKSATLIVSVLGILFCTNLFGQSSELYVFKDERKEHLEAAKRARAVAREKAVANDFYMRVRTLTSLSTAKMQVDMKKSHDTVIRVTDMNGSELAMLFQGELAEGQYEFTYEPEGNLRKPFVCQLLIDGKTEAMKVVKFNSF
ncbi:MAG: hypothetical protein K9J17_17935 [Flavobacteriales bacterium]|nr:hypothetical protein [Flavobacteriales bacterium]